MILVAGGTGTLGRRVVHRLAGEPVRVLTRDPARAASLPPGVETVRGDLRDPASVAAAVRGCATVVSAVQGFAGPGRQTPEAVDRDGNRTLVRAARDAGVEHVVLLSVHGAAPDHPMSLFRAKAAAERDVRASGLAWTIVRPTAFLETWVGIIGAGVAEKGTAQVLGPGRNPLNFVSADDAAAVVELAVHGPALRGRAVHVAGPENLSFTAVAERIIAASGRPGRTRHIPLPVLRAMAVLARPVSPALARQAGAAVVMNTTDMAADGSALRREFPTLPSTTLDDILRLDPAALP